MPGSQQLHLRITQEQLDRFKTTASTVKMSLTAFALTVLDHAANKVLGGNTELVGTSTPAQKVQSEPSRSQGFTGRDQHGRPTPDTPIGEMTLAEIKRWVKTEEEYERLQNDQDY